LDKKSHSDSNKKGEFTGKSNQKSKYASKKDNLSFWIIFGIFAVIGIVFIYSMIRRGRGESQYRDCTSNIQNLASSLDFFYEKHRKYPDKKNWKRELFEKSGAESPYKYPEPKCASNGATYGYGVDKSGQVFTVHCRGAHYKRLKEIPEGYPQYSSGYGFIRDPKVLRGIRMTEKKIRRPVEFP